MVIERILRRVVAPAVLLAGVAGLFSGCLYVPVGGPYAGPPPGPVVVAPVPPPVVVAPGWGWRHRWYY